MIQAGLLIDAMAIRGDLPIRIYHRYAGLFKWSDSEQRYESPHAVATAAMVRSQWQRLFFDAPSVQSELSF